MNNKSNCYICEQHRRIAEEHYIVPLEEIKRTNKKMYKDEIIYLCPNCHTYLHLLLNGKRLDDVFEYFNLKNVKERLSKLYARYFYLKAKNERCCNENR